VTALVVIDGNPAASIDGLLTIFVFMDDVSENDIDPLLGLYEKLADGAALMSTEYTAAPNISYPA
jgi:hypothetical protein